MSGQRTGARRRSSRPTRGRANLERLRSQTEEEIAATSPPDLADLPGDFWDRAIIVTPLFGNPCDMDPILELAASKNIPVIEDAAQAYHALYKGRRAGTMGDIGCFSLQQGKHMTTGEGGVVIAKDDVYTRRMTLFVDKAWGYGDPNPDHYCLAPNYRMTELQGAVAVAQLDKVEAVVASRVKNAKLMDSLIEGLAGMWIWCV